MLSVVAGELPISTIAVWMPSDGAVLVSAGFIAWSGVAFLTIVAVLLAPVFHRFLHRFHLELANEPEDRTRPR